LAEIVDVKSGTGSDPFFVDRSNSRLYYRKASQVPAAVQPEHPANQSFCVSATVY